MCTKMLFLLCTLQLQERDMAAAKSLRAAFTKVHLSVCWSCCSIATCLTIKVGYYFRRPIVTFYSKVSWIVAVVYLCMTVGEME